MYCIKFELILIKLKLKNSRDITMGNSIEMVSDNTIGTMTKEVTSYKHHKHPVGNECGRNLNESMAAKSVQKCTPEINVKPF